MTKRVTRGKAIRLKCLDCCCGSAFEVRRCESRDCPLWRYRLGREIPAENGTDAAGLKASLPGRAAAQPGEGSP